MERVGIGLGTLIATLISWHLYHCDMSNVPYPALVHCFTSLTRADTSDGPATSKRTFILVKYSGGQYTDGGSLTAKYITPIAVIEGSILTKFYKMEKTQGFEATVKSFLAAKYWLED